MEGDATDGMKVVPLRAGHIDFKTMLLQLIEEHPDADSAIVIIFAPPGTDDDESACMHIKATMQQASHAVMLMTNHVMDRLNENKYAP